MKIAKIHCFFQNQRMKFYKLIGKIKRQLWNRGLLLFWYRLYIRKDVFHHSLDIDPEAIKDLSMEKLMIYLKDINKRRKIAEQKEQILNNKKYFQTNKKANDEKDIYLREQFL